MDRFASDIYSPPCIEKDDRMRTSDMIKDHMKGIQVETRK